VRQLTGRHGGARLRSAGLRIATTLSPRLQRLAQRALDSWLAADGDPAGALVAIDPRTGGIRALATRVPGGRRMRFNLATQSHRQAGSAFKTFTLTAAVERGIPPSSVWNGPQSLTIPDRRCMTGYTPWTVHNFADEVAGRMTLLGALAHSVNTIFAQVALKVGLQNIVDVAHRLGVRSPLKPVCAITLGPEGVSPLEMTSAFATLAAGGIRRAPVAVRRVTTRDGGVLPQPRPRAAGDQRAHGRARLPARPCLLLSLLAASGTKRSRGPTAQARAGALRGAERRQGALLSAGAPLSGASTLR
jgi:penicillin-binding protein 1A